MNLIQYLSPLNPPAHIRAQGAIQITRERILQTLLVILALVVVAADVYFAFQLLPQNPIQYLVYIGPGMAALAFMAYRKLHFTIRSLILILVVFGVSITTFYNTGIGGNGTLYLITTFILSTVLLGWKFGIGAMIFGQAALAGLGYLMVNSKIPITIEALLNGSADPNRWASSWIFLTIVSGLITVCLSLLLYGLEKAYGDLGQVSQDLEVERASLKKRVDEQTADLQLKVNQIFTASDISKTIVSYRDPALLLPKIVELVKTRFNLYYVGLFLVDQNNNAVLKAGTGEAGAKMMTAGHYLPVGGNSMIGWSIANRQARIALDVGKEAVRFNNPYLPETRSEIALPIVLGETSLGAMTIQSTLPQAFSQEDIQILHTITDSLAIALENARLFQQTQESLDEVKALNREYLQSNWISLIDERGNLGYTYENTELGDASGINNEVKIPLTLRDQVIGQITLETSDSALSSEQADLIETITTQTALALENARLLEETQRRAFQEQTLNQLTAEFSRVFSIDEILKSALRQLGQLPVVHDVSVHLLSPKPVGAAGIHLGGNGNGNGNGKEVN